MADTDFAEKSVLEILVPEGSKLDIETALNTAVGNLETDDESTLISAIPQRSLLYFGMLDMVFLATISYSYIKQYR